jgi:hypothetical protein
MSTRYDTTDQQAPYQQAPYQQAPYQQAPEQKGGGPSWFRICVVVVGTAVAVALVALAVAVSHSHSSQAPGANGTPTSTSAPAQRTTQPTTPAQPTTPVSPAHPVQPSAAVVKLQQELGQLNYYEGPDDGIMGPQTIQAITYLQRDAHLPQTGQMNAATQAALASFLAHGNNQMAG